VLAGLDKHYLVDKPPDLETLTAELEAPPVPLGPLPVDLFGPGDAANFRIDIADDVQQAVADTYLAEATLRVLIVRLTFEDEEAIRLNGESLDRLAATTRLL
jgi:hypothetical protein